MVEIRNCVALLLQDFRCIYIRECFFVQLQRSQRRFFDALLAIHLTAAMMYRWFVTKRDFPDDARGRDARVGYALPTPRRGNQELLAQPKHLLE